MGKERSLGAGCVLLSTPFDFQSVSRGPRAPTLLRVATDPSQLPGKPRAFQPRVGWQGEPALPSEPRCAGAGLEPSPSPRAGSQSRGGPPWSRGCRGGAGVEGAKPRERLNRVGAERCALLGPQLPLCCCSLSLRKQEPLVRREHWFGTQML